MPFMKSIIKNLLWYYFFNKNTSFEIFFFKHPFKTKSLNKVSFIYVFSNNINFSKICLALEEFSFRDLNFVYVYDDSLLSDPSDELVDDNFKISLLAYCLPNFL